MCELWASRNSSWRKLTVKIDDLRAATRSHDILNWKFHNSMNSVEFCHQRKWCNCDVKIYSLFKVLPYNIQNRCFQTVSLLPCFYCSLTSEEEVEFTPFLSTTFLQNSRLESKVQSQPSPQVIWQSVQTCVKCTRFGVLVSVISSYGNISGCNCTATLL